MLFRSVIYIGEDLDVLMQISDRLLVMNNGKVTGIVDPRETDKNEVGLMMLGTDKGEISA